MSTVSRLIGGNIDPVASGSTYTYGATLLDENGVAIAGSDISAMTLSIVETSTGEIINNVDEINILNVDRGTIDANGKLTIVAGAVGNEKDTTLLSAASQNEVRSLIIDFVYGTPAKRGRHEVQFQIVALTGP